LLKSFRRSRKKGFTLVELLVVVAILVILLVALIPSALGYSDCYATGEVTGNEFTGGLVGSNAPGAFCYYCYYDKETTGQSGDTGKGIPLTTAEMKNSANFTDWDFIITWSIEENNSYPYLQPNEQIPHPGIN
jgi:prepilin-type N-terminal cleavage/methylation domain-containing protein